MGSGVTFVARREDSFRKILKQRVDAYFAETGKSRHANWLMVTKTVLLLAAFAGGYATLVLAPTLGLTVLAGIFIGLAMAGIGFNVAHDACHGSYSRHDWVNRLVAHSFTLIGVHAYNWRFIHNIIHHTFTNIPERDGDLHVPIVRYCADGAPRRWHHRFQHIYAYALYSLASLTWVFWKDYRHMARTSHMGYDKRPAPVMEYVWLAASKLLHYTLFLIVPLAVLGRPVGEVLLAFVAMHLVAGFVLATVFAAAHLVEEVDQPRTNDNGVIPESWFAHQMRTTANFATGSTALTLAVGGLNYQIEHHLFPNICHVHYPALAPIVRATARELGLPYVEFATFMDAQLAHMRFLRRHGAAEEMTAQAAQAA